MDILKTEKLPDISFSSWSTGNAKNAQTFKATCNTSTEAVFTYLLTDFGIITVHKLLKLCKRFAPLQTFVTLCCISLI